MSPMANKLYVFKGCASLVAMSLHFIVEINRGNSKFYATFFFSQNSRLSKYLPVFCFQVKFDFEKRQCNVNCYILPYYLCSFIILSPLYKQKSMYIYHK